MAEKEHDYGLCRICSHKSTGNHYGVSTCDECKWFFKRSIVVNETFTCFFKNNCLITKFSRNRCKACRLQKCLSLGMSIEESDMERIRRLVFERAAKHDLSNQKTDLETDEDELKRKKTLDLSNEIHLSLKINPDHESMNYMNTFNVQNILNRHSTFKSSNMVVKTSINENFIIFISLLKNKVYQTYRIKILESNLVRNSKERLRTGDFIKLDQLSESHFTRDNIIEVRSDVQDWLKDFAIHLPGFDKFDSEDLNNIVEISTSLLFLFLISEFFVADNITVIFKNVQMSNNVFEKIFGRTYTDLVLNFFKDFNQLKLNDYEKALFFPFVLTSCNPNRVKDRLCLLHLKAKYTRALIYEFELSQRYSTFYQNLVDVFSLISRLEAFKNKLMNK